MYVAERSTLVEGAAAVAPAPAVGVHDDLAPGEAAVAVGAADLEAAGGVDVELDVVLPPVAQHGLEDMLDDFLAEGVLPVVPCFVVLRAHDERAHARGLAGGGVVGVLDGDLALGVGAQALDDALAPDDRLALHEAVRELDRQGHVFFGLAACEAKHHALVAGAFFIDAHGDVGRLLFDALQHRHRLEVEGHVRIGVADLLHRVAHDLVDVHPAVDRALAAHHGHARRDHRLAGDAGVGVLGQHGVEDGVGDLIGDLVGVPHRDGFRGEQAGHAACSRVVRRPGDDARGDAAEGPETGSCFSR